MQVGEISFVSVPDAAAEGSAGELRVIVPQGPPTRQHLQRNEESAENQLPTATHGSSSLSD